MIARRPGRSMRLALFLSLLGAGLLALTLIHLGSRASPSLSPVERVQVIQYEDLIPYWEAAITREADPNAPRGYWVKFCPPRNERFREMVRRNPLLGSIATMSLRDFWEGADKAPDGSILVRHSREAAFPQGVFQAADVEVGMTAALEAAKLATIEAIGAQKETPATAPVHAPPRDD